MKTTKNALILVGIAALLLGLAAQALATGGHPALEECCLVTNPGAGKIALKGTMTLVYDPANDFNSDVTLRLERGGSMEFFRVNFSGTSANLTTFTNEKIACLTLNPREWQPDDPNRAKVTAFVNRILCWFFEGTKECMSDYSGSWSLVITRSSISNAQGVYECEVGDEPTKCVIPGTTRVSSLGDITVYAVETRKANYVYPACSVNP